MFFFVVSKFLENQTNRTYASVKSQNTMQIRNYFSFLTQMKMKGSLCKQMETLEPSWRV